MSDKEVVAIMAAIIFCANSDNQSANVTGAVDKALELFQAVEGKLPQKQRKTR
jgi:hypothetical protein